MPQYVPITDNENVIKCQTFVDKKDGHCGEPASFLVKGTPGNYWSGWHCDEHALDVCRSMGHQYGSIVVPVVRYSGCGPTDDEMFCACGCGGDDSRCPLWIDCYRATPSRQVPESHTCCKINGLPGGYYPEQPSVE